MRGINLRWALLPAELLGCRFGRLDMLYAIISAVCAVLVVGVWPSCPWDAAAMCGSAFFGACLFSAYRLMLPMLLGITVGDMLRYRLAFLTACLAGAISVMASPIFALTFVDMNFSTVSILGGCFGLWMMLSFIKSGSRLRLSLAFYICGCVSILHPIGALSLLGICLPPFAVVVRRNRSARMYGSDSMYGKQFFDEMDDVYSHVRRIGRSLILCFISVVLGVVTMAVVLYVGSKYIPELDLASMPSNYAMCAKAYRADGYVMLFALTSTLLFLAFCFSRQATDVQRVFSLQMTLLFLALGAGAVTVPTGIIEKIPPFSTLGCSVARSMSLIPDCFAAFVLVLCASYVIVEVCCREDAREKEYFLGELSSDDAPDSTRGSRGVRAAAIAVLSLAASVVFVLFRLHRLGMF